MFTRINAYDLVFVAYKNGWAKAAKVFSNLLGAIVFYVSAILVFIFRLC